MLSHRRSRPQSSITRSADASTLVPSDSFGHLESDRPPAVVACRSLAHEISELAVDPDQAHNHTRLAFTDDTFARNPHTASAALRRVLTSLAVPSIPLGLGQEGAFRQNPLLVEAANTQNSE